jgi:hypothetical protein
VSDAGIEPATPPVLRWAYARRRRGSVRVELLEQRPALVSGPALALGMRGWESASVSDRAVGQAAAALDPEARLEAQNQVAVKLEQGREPRQPELRRMERPAQSRLR